MNNKRFINIFWLFFENFGLVILSVFSFFSFALYLTPAELGLGTLAIVLCELVGSFYSSVFETPLIRRGANSKKELSSVFWFGGLLSGLTILSIAGIYFLIDSESSVWKMLIFSTISVLSSILARPYIAKLRCNRQFKSLALRTLWGKIVGALLGIVCAVMGAGEWSLIVQLTAMNIVAFLILLKTDSPLFLEKPSKDVFISILMEGTSIGFRKLLSGFFGRGIVIILSVVTTPAIIGYYSFGRRLIELPKQALLAALNSYAMPVFSNRSDNSSVIGHLFTELTVCVFLLTFPAFVFMGIFGKEVITDIFGEKWNGAIDFFVVFAFVSGVQMIIAFTETLQAAFGRSNIGMRAEVAKTICLLTIAYFVADKYGLMGVGIVIGLDFIFNLIIRYYAVYKLIETKKWRFWVDISKIIVGTCITAIAAYYSISWMSPSISVLFGMGLLTVLLQAVIMILFFGLWPKRVMKLLTDTH